MGGGYCFYFVTFELHYYHYVVGFIHQTEFTVTCVPVAHSWRKTVRLRLRLRLHYQPLCMQHYLYGARVLDRYKINQSGFVSTNVSLLNDCFELFGFLCEQNATTGSRTVLQAGETSAVH
jgi:hypothetical protein